ncbi:F-box/kelch-repeat protein At1g16250-like [Cornus florida]|uniref:F-box/kelch-repeat protein At1g16250-like n=1 Tax=Cornus florida TaxID=4283 RepID=UPI0028A2C306|nr:F-box/kelch-repeat protein At1g16250-like [Cornus florida]
MVVVMTRFQRGEIPTAVAVGFVRKPSLAGFDRLSAKVGVVLGKVSESDVKDDFKVKFLYYVYMPSDDMQSVVLKRKSWEDLPPMPSPQMDCLGLSYKGKLYILSDQVGLPDQTTSEVFNPSDRTWCTVDDIWPFSRAMHLAVQVIGDDQVYTVVDLGESSIKTRDTENGEWRHVGSVPSVVLPNHPRPLESFGHGFAALRGELYIFGGKVLKWDPSGTGRFEIVKLGLVRVCDPSFTPLKWKETRPMCSSAHGSIIGCGSLEEESHP